MDGYLLTNEGGYTLSINDLNLWWNCESHSHDHKFNWVWKASAHLCAKNIQFELIIEEPNVRYSWVSFCFINFTVHSFPSMLLLKWMWQTVSSLTYGRRNHYQHGTTKIILELCLPIHCRTKGVTFVPLKIIYHLTKKRWKRDVKSDTIEDITGLVNNTKKFPLDYLPITSCPALF